MRIDKPEIRLAMLGMIEGNGHPYSWSAIVNGYNPEEMAKCPFPMIIAGLRSREREWQLVKLDEIYAKLEPPFKR
jgi:hypothetical protein